MNKILLYVLLALSALAMTACVNETDFTPTGEGGRLQLSLTNISTATTRANPGELGKPSAENFWVYITNAVGREIYNGVYTEEEFSVSVGDYTIVATCGTDNLLAADRPYYEGTQTVTVERDMLTQASLTATVANALVSVRFGVDDEERARFERFYADYALRVYVGDNNMSISKDETGKSIYVRAGSAVVLKFWGKLRFENEREVSCELGSEDFPEVLNAADHAIVTLSLPDPESSVGPDIAKVEVETMTLGETIPLSWLPAAVTVPQHQYDKAGNLVGTNLLIADAFPGQKWRAVITNQAGTTVRSVEGTGSLESHYNSTTNASTWPYLPQGQYTAKYYLVDDENHASYQNSRDFTVPAPKLSITVDGYTSYDKYLAGDIDAANACDRLTIYEPSVKVNVSTALLGNSNIAKSFTYTYDGTTANVTTGNTYAPGNMAGQTVRSEVHVLRGDLTFDGVSVSAQKEFRITGLPYTVNFASHGEWTESRSNEISWNSDNVKLGGWATNINGQTITNTSSLNIPQGTKYCASYAVNVRTGTAGTTFTITVGGQEILSISESGRIFNVGGTDHYHSSTTDTFTANSNLTSLVCKNSWGDGQSSTTITSLVFKYAR